MKTYNFIVLIGSLEYIIEVNASCEDEALDIMSREYPRTEGWRYMLI